MRSLFIVVRRVKTSDETMCTGDEGWAFRFSTNALDRSVSTSLKNTQQLDITHPILPLVLKRK